MIAVIIAVLILIGVIVFFFLILMQFIHSVKRAAEKEKCQRRYEEMNKVDKNE